MKKPLIAAPLILLPILFILFSAGCNQVTKADAAKTNEKNGTDSTTSGTAADTAPFDTADYNKKILALSNNDTTGKWPVKTVYPLPGALLPYHRIVAFYGNLYSKRMGILGELPKDSMFKKLKQEVAAWQAADPTTKTIPSLHYVAITAQGAPGKDGKHRMRMPFHQIDTILDWAKQIGAVVFVDIQVGHSTVKDEVPTLEKYLQLSNVHLGIDPEFSMKNGERPGSKIGTFTSDDINDAIDFLAAVVRKNKLSPKILVVEPGKRLSWQYHHRRAEIWRVVEGEVGIIMSDSDEQTALNLFEPGDVIILENGKRHRLVGLNDWGVVAEIWQHTDTEHPSDEDDIVRLQDDFGR